MELTNDRYTIQDLNVLDICHQFGTPLYVYDAEHITNQIRTLKSAFSNYDLKIKYAAKALTNISILKHILQQGCGIDAVSIYEVKLALKVGFEPQDIIFTPNCVDFDEIIEGIEMGVMINLDNLFMLEQFGRRYRNTYPCCVRLNPHIMAGGNSKISTGHVNSKFGISIFQLPQIKSILSQYKIDVVGLHIHTGSEIADTSVFLRMAEILFGLAFEFSTLKFIDFGSGFKVPYKKDDLATNVYDLGLRLGKSFDAFCARYGRKLELWMEPGKYLVSEAGYLFTTVNVVKSTPSVTFVGINSGLNHFIRPMMYDVYHDIVNITNPNGLPKLYTVVGNICETDTFGMDRKMNEVREGDVLVIRNAGAYGYSMSSNFNSRLKPAEVMVLHGQAKLIREREIFEDLLRGQVEFDT